MTEVTAVDLQRKVIEKMVVKHLCEDLGDVWVMQAVTEMEAKTRSIL